VNGRPHPDPAIILYLLMHGIVHNALYPLVLDYGTVWSGAGGFEVARTFETHS